MTQSHSILTLSIAAAVAIAANRFVTTAGQYATADGNADGVSRSDAAIGDLFPADILGTAVITAGGAIAKDAYVEVGASGKAVTHTTGVAVAKALQASAADGDRIEVLLIPNAPIPA